MDETVQQKRRKTEEKSKFPHGDLLVTIMSFLKVVEKAFMKTVCKDFAEACECSDSCVGTLDLKGIPAAKFGKIVASMPKRTFVKKLNLSELDFVENDFFPLVRFGLKFTRLQHLNVSCTDITDRVLKCISWMPLKSLNLTCCEEITDAGLVSIKRMQQLTKLSMEYCPQITNASLVHLSGLPLETLSLPFEITDDDIRHLPVMLCRIKSTDINSFSSEITDAGLVQLARLTSLVNLSFSECHRITDAGLRHLAHLKLKYLILSDCSNVTDEGMKYLSYMPLTELNLSYSKITDRGLAYLARLRLESLNLNWCSEITDAGIAHISGSKMEYLKLRGCNLLTDASMSVIGGMPSLKSLELSGCKRITSDALMAYIPNMRLYVLRVGGISFTPLSTRQFVSSVAPTHVYFESSAPDDDAPDDEM